jgi:hypothetical protein
VNNTGRRAEFFALEAGEYLADLAPLASARDLPDAERLVRGARALRGAALMAGLGTYARAAAGLEAIARQVREHALAWEPNAREAWQDGLATLRGLLTRAATWEAADDRQALMLADRLERVAGGLPGRSTAPAPPALTPGVRAFIARESALIAGSLEQAANALAPVPPPAALAAVLDRMQSLRGLGTSAELSPLPELLDAMEVATRTLLAEIPGPPDIAAIFADAARALAAMARTVADAGRITPPPELDAVAARLLDSYTAERDIVPIAALAPAGSESILQRGTPPDAAPAADAVPVELVGVGDHLLIVADAMARPSSPAARDLRLFVLHRTLTTMPARSGTGRFLAPLAAAITGAITGGIATQRPDAFIAMLRDCGRFLSEAASSGDQARLARDRDLLATSFGIPTIAVQPVEPSWPALDAAPVPLDIAAFEPEPEVPAAVDIAMLAPAPVAPDLADVVDIARLAPDAADVADIVDIATLAPEPDAALPTVVTPAADLAVDDDIVSIESLAPTNDPATDADTVSIESLAPDVIDIPLDAPGEPSRLEQAFHRRQLVAAERGAEDASLAALLQIEIVPVETLLYRGTAALGRADEIRTDILTMLSESAVSLQGLRPLIHELLDLVPLARDAA